MRRMYGTSAFSVVIRREDRVNSGVYSTKGPISGKEFLFRLTITRVSQIEKNFTIIIFLAGIDFFLRMCIQWLFVNTFKCVGMIK